MRGKAQKRHSGSERLRITLAHAGKSIYVDGEAVESADHPRTCGEKYKAKRENIKCVGSPPHMRGKAQKRHSGSERLRITLAHAGKSQWLYNVQKEL